MGDVDLERLSEKAGTKLPTGKTAYPLCKVGERFPFAHTEARGFGLLNIRDPVVRFAAGMEGVAMLERLGIERLQQLGLPIRQTVFATGGAAANDVWLRIRATVTGRVYQLPRWPECAVGAAVVAAMPTMGSFAAAAATMIGFGRTVEPDARLAARYDEQYASFLGALRHHGYLRENSTSG
jgi:sugar (pentulose or hexulose) kinase